VSDDDDEARDDENKDARIACRVVYYSYQ